MTTVVILPCGRCPHRHRAARWSSRCSAGRVQRGRRRRDRRRDRRRLRGRPACLLRRISSASAPSTRCRTRARPSSSTASRTRSTSSSASRSTPGSGSRDWRWRSRAPTPGAAVATLAVLRRRIGGFDGRRLADTSAGALLARGLASLGDLGDLPRPGLVDDRARRCVTTIVGADRRRRRFTSPAWRRCGCGSWRSCGPAPLAAPVAARHAGPPRRLERPIAQERRATVVAAAANPCLDGCRRDATGR